MITSDGSVIERAADLGITYFDTARGYSGGNNERMVGAALKGKRNQITLSTKTARRDQAGSAGGHRQEPVGAGHGPCGYLVPARQELAGGGHRRPDRGAADRQEGRQDPVRGREHPPGAKGIAARGWPRTRNVDVILTAYNFTMEPFMNDVIAEASKAGKGIVCMKVMAGGTRGRGATPAITESCTATAR